jgi:hypothetical protein
MGLLDPDVRYWMLHEVEDAVARLIKEPRRASA